MSVRTDQVQLLVTINGDAAKNQLNELKKKAAETKDELDGMKKNTAEWKKKKEELKGLTDEMTKLKQSVGLNSLSLKELRNELKKLNAMKGSLTPFSDEFKQVEAQIRKVESRIYDVKNGVQGFSSTWSKMKDEVKQFGMLAVGYLGFEFLSSQIKNIISNSGKLSDQLADIRRVTGMTDEEVRNLNKSLTQLNTRTSTSSLREIAIIAGKLGVASQDIFEFTKAVDQLVVALGDELGDADTITTQLGKILNVFDGKVTAEGLTGLGNAFVELANAGVASGGWLADFAQRVSGIAKAANIGIGEILGLGAALEEMGGRTESSATAIQKLINNINSDVPKAARAAGIELKEFQKLLSEKPQEALLRYAEGLVKNKSAFSEIVLSFKDAGEEGARVVETLLKIGQNADMVRQKMDMGATSLKNNTAITEAFNLKNETLGATLDKLGKAFNRLFINSGITSGLQNLATGMLNLLTPSQSVVETFEKKKEAFDSLQASTIPLIEKIEKLQSKTNLSKEEQAALKTAIEQVGLVIPGAVTQFDKLGNAIGLSTDKAREFLKQQKAILAVENRDAIKETETRIQAIQKEMDYNVRWADSVKKEGERLASNEKKTAEDRTRILNNYNKTAREILARNRDLEGELLGTKGKLKLLKGEPLVEPDQKTESTGSEGAATTSLTGTDEARKKAIEKARRDYEALMKEIDRMLKMADGNKITKIIEDANKKAEELTDRLRQDVLGGNLTREDLQNGMKKIEELRGSLIKEGIKKLNDSAKEMEAKLVIPVIPELEANNEDGKRQIENAINRYMLSLRDDFAKARRMFISSGPFDLERFKKHKEMLEAMKAIELDNVALTEEEKLMIEEEFNQQRIDAWESTVDHWHRLGEMVVSGWRSINNILSNIDRQRLQREERNAERQKKKFQEQLDSKLISQEQYNLQISKLEDDMEAKRRKAARDQAKRDKAANIFEATINTAAAVAKVIWNPVLAAIVGALGALQIGVIATTPLPELRRGKWFKSGAKHEQGGIPVEIEVGEAVMTSNTMLDPNQYTVSGTPAQITSALNSLGGGEAWASGAVVQQTPWIRNAAPSINPNMPRIMTQNNSPVNEAQQNNVVNVDLQGLVNEMQEFRRDVNNWARNIKADIIIEEFREKESIYDAARDASRILPV